MMLKALLELQAKLKVSVLLLIIVDRQKLPVLYWEKPKCYKLTLNL
nr:MAG TPA: hypothetical protein [Caudoviricetes sp.]